MFLKKYQRRTNTKCTLNISNAMDENLLPPWRSAREMYIRRVNYKSLCGYTPMKKQQGLIDLDKSGWKINWEEMEFDRVKRNLNRPEQLIDILCEQNVERDADQDRNDGDDDEGVEMTNMVDEVLIIIIVFEDESDDDED